jgi:hypothetical protein
MTEADESGAALQPRATSRRRALPVYRIVALGGFTIAAVLGAWGDWVLWVDYKGLMITIAAIAILLAAVVLRVIPFHRSHKLALLVAAVGVGVLAGQNLGPSRPALAQTEGTITVALTSPNTVTATASATCSMDARATELSVDGDPNLRLDVLPRDPSAPVDLDQRAFVGMTVSIGDRWMGGPEPRPDAVLLSTWVSGVIGKSPESRMVTGSSSPVAIHWDRNGGTMAFSGLIRDLRYPDDIGAPIDLAGTITWTCSG